MIIVVIIFSLFLIVLFSLNETYLWVVLRNSQEVQILKGKTRQKKYDAVAFGSAYCRYSIDFADYNGYNFGIASQFFHYTDMMLKDIVPNRLKKGGIVFIIIADLVFAREGKGLLDPQRYQLLLSKNALGDEFSLRGFIKERYPVICNPLLIKKIFESVLKRIVKKTGTIQTNIEGGENSAIKAARGRCRSWCEDFGLTDTITSIIPQQLEEEFIKSRQLLSGMIEYCLKNGCRPVLVVTPVSEIMNKELGEEFVNKVLYDNIRLSNIHNVLFLDYLRDCRFSDYRLYQNGADLMNVKSRKKFTEILLRDSSLI